jgi:hypothetical protein
MSAAAFRAHAAIWAPVASAVLLVVGFFADPDIAAEGRELAREYAENPGWIQVSANALRLAFALLIVPTFVLVALVRRRGAWIANAAAALAVIGLTTLPGLLVVDFYDLAIYDQVGGDAWQRVSDRLEELPGMIVLALSAFVGAILALPVALAAAWRARLLPWWPAAVALAGPVVGQAVPEGYGLFVWAAALLVVAWVLRRLVASDAGERLLAGD